MSGQDATAEYLDFLRARNAVTHIVAAPAGVTLSTLALTQRCLASGVEFPVPLPDGRVAINLAGEVPLALAALDLSIVSAGSDGAEDRLEEEADMTFASEDAAALDAALPDTAAHDDDFVEPAADEFDEEDGTFADLSEEDAPTEMPVAADEADLIEDDAPAMEEDADADDAFVDADNLADGSAPQDSVPVEETVADSPLYLVAEQDDLSTSDADIAETPSWEDVPTEDAAEDETSMTYAANAADTVDDTESGEDMPVPSDARDRIARIEAMLTRLEDRFASIENGQAGLTAKVETFSGALEDAMSRPVPRPDVSAFNRGMSRMMTALSQTIRRIEDVLEHMLQDGGGGANDVATSLATGLSALADAVRATQTGQSTTAADLEVITGMQKTLSLQLAKLLEASQAQRAPMMEELLMDIRHATAELVAEQARVARAS